MASTLLDKRPTILVIEDSDTCQAAIEIALSSLDGFHIRTCSTAEEALEVLEATGNVCALVTDLHLPGIDGLELIKRVLANAKWQTVPIVVISGDTDPRTPSHAVELGAAAYFEKPYSPSKVRQTLERLIHAKHRTSSPA